MKLVGVTRFSLVTQRTLGSFRATKGKSLEEAKEIVYSRESLIWRMKFFENFCLSTYRAMSEQDEGSFGLVLINKDLPKPFKDLLLDMCASVDRLEVLELKDDQSPQEVVKPVVRIMAAGDRIYSYRYDDDDALPNTYIPSVRRICKDLAPNSVVSFNNGYSLSRVGDDCFGMHVRNYPLNAFGLGVVSDNNNLKTIFELGPHTKITLPTYHDTDNIGWLSTVHQSNDSRVGEMKSKIYSGKEIIDQISSLFPHVTLTGIQQLSFRRPADVTG